MSFLQKSFLFGFCPTLGLMAFFWLWQRQKSMADIIDVGWALCLGYLATLYTFLTKPAPIRACLFLIIVWGWSLRLSHHLFFNRFLKGIEDGRYQTLRRMWGQKAQPYFLVLFLGQSVLAYLLAVTFVPIVTHSGPLKPLWGCCAALTWLVSVAGESWADHQLKVFRSNPENRGGICRQGLWRFSRHPNYFFEWVYWFCFIFLAIGHTQWWLSWVGPTVMFVFLNFITGVPPIEARMLASRKDAFLDYQRKTSRFFPWFERK